MKPWKRAKTGVGEGPKMVERRFICVKIFFFLCFETNNGT